MTATIYTIHGMFTNADIKVRSVNTTHWISIETPWNDSDGKPQLEITLHFDTRAEMDVFMQNCIDQFVKSLHPVVVVQPEPEPMSRPIPAPPEMDDEIPF